MPAKKNTEKTPLQKAAEQARETYKTAKERLEKQDNAANKTALDKAQTAMREAIKNENRERFKTLGSTRVSKVIKMVKTLGNVANPRAYEYTAEDVAKAFQRLQQELNNVKAKFEASLKSGAGKSAAPQEFSFD